MTQPRSAWALLAATAALLAACVRAADPVWLKPGDLPTTASTNPAGEVFRRFPSATVFTLSDLNPLLGSTAGALDGAANCAPGSDAARRKYSVCLNEVSLFSGLTLYSSEAGDNGLQFLGTTDRGPNQVWYWYLQCSCHCHWCAGMLPSECLPACFHESACRWAAPRGCACRRRCHNVHCARPCQRTAPSPRPAVPLAPACRAARTSRTRSRGRQRASPASPPTTAPPPATTGGTPTTATTPTRAAP